MDADEKHVVTVAAHQRGDAQITIEKAGQNRITLGTGEDPGKFAGLIVLANAGQDKQGGIAFAYNDDGKPSLVFNDHNDKTRAAIMLGTGGRPMLSLQDERERSVFSQAQP